MHLNQKINPCKQRFPRIEIQLLEYTIQEYISLLLLYFSNMINCISDHLTSIFPANFWIYRYLFESLCLRGSHDLSSRRAQRIMWPPTRSQVCKAPRLEVNFICFSPASFINNFIFHKKMKTIFTKSILNCTSQS